MSNLKNLIDYNLPICFQALSNPVRFQVYVKILEEACDCNLSEKGRLWGNCVTKISTTLGIPQPTVSNHVRELMNCGLIRTERKGKHIYLFGTEESAKKFANFCEFMTKEIEGHDH